MYEIFQGGGYCTIHIIIVVFRISIIIIIMIIIIIIIIIISIISIIEVSMDNISYSRFISSVLYYYYSILERLENIFVIGVIAVGLHFLLMMVLSYLFSIGCTC